MQALHVAFDIMLETAASLACSTYDPAISFSSVSIPPKRGTIKSRGGSGEAQGLGVNAHPPRKP